MSTETVLRPQTQELFRTLEAYPWDADEEYQHGLKAILGSNANEEQAKHLTLRARCFYYARKFSVPVDFASYETWHHDQNKETQLRDEKAKLTSAIPTEVQEEPPRYPLSFNEIVELITTGKPVPGIKDIPNTILEGQSSGSTASSRKKPWET